MNNLNNINVLIKITDNKIWFKRITDNDNDNEWIPLNPKSIDNSGLDIITLIKLKLIELDDYPIS